MFLYFRLVYFQLLCLVALVFLILFFPVRFYFQLFLSILSLQLSLVLGTVCIFEFISFPQCSSTSLYYNGPQSAASDRYRSVTRLVPGRESSFVVLYSDNSESFRNEDGK